MDRRRFIGLSARAAAAAVVGAVTLSSTALPAAAKKKPASNLLVNPSFEQATSGTAIPGWSVS